MHQVKPENYRKLFELLSDDYTFPIVKKPITIEEYLNKHPHAEAFSASRELIIETLIPQFLSFDDQVVNKDSILNELVDSVVGLDSSIIDETIEECIKSKPTKSISPQHSRYSYFQKENSKPEGLNQDPFDNSEDEAEGLKF